MTEPVSAAPPGANHSFAARYGLIRPTGDRKLGGVCAGIGRATDTDPLLWRVLFGAGALFGGAGLLAYLVGWLLMPEEGDTGSPLEALLGRGESRASAGVTVVLASAAALLVVVTAQWAPVAALLAAFCGYLLYRQRHPSGTWQAATIAVPPAAPDTTTPTGAPGGPAAASPHGAPPRQGTVAAAGSGRDEVTVEIPVTAPRPTQAGPAEAGPVEPGRETTDAPGEATGEVGAETGSVPVDEETDLLALAERYRDGTHLLDPQADPTGGRDAGAPPPGFTWPTVGTAPPGRSGTPGAAWPAPAGERPVPARRRFSPTLARTAGFTILVALGVVGAIDLAGGGLGVSAYVAAALAVVGAALVVGGWIGRPPWLIGTGVLLSLALAVSVAWESVDLTAAGNRTWHPTAVNQIAPRYDIMLGDGTLDLRRVDFTGENVRIDIRANASNLVVLLPPDVDVTGQAHLRFGNADLIGEGLSGNSVDRRFADLGRDNAAGPGQIVFDIDVNATNLELKR